MTDSSTSDAVVPSTGLTVLHLFCHTTDRLDPQAVVTAVKSAEADDAQVISAAMLGHKADVAFMVLHPDMRVHHRLQAALQAAGLRVSDSYVSITEVSEYAKGMPAEMLQPRLYPTLPPEGKHAFCFYPMSKRREDGANWFTLPYAADKSDSAQPSVFASAISDISSSGSSCTVFADCAALLADGRSIDYSGADGLLEISDDGDVATARFDVFSFDDQGRDVSVSGITVTSAGTPTGS